MGRILFQLGNFEDSLINFQKVLQFNPDNADAWNNLGLVYESQNKFPDALVAFRKSLSLNPFHEETNLNIAELQYLMYKSSPERIKISDIVRRLHYILSLNPHNQNVTKLLSRIEKEN